MGSKKTTTTQSNQHGWMTPTDTQDIKTLRALGQQVDLRSGINAAYGKAENDIKNQYYEDDLPDGVADEVRASKMFGLRQNQGIDLMNAAGQEQLLKTGNQATVAGMTAPQLVQTGGTSTTVQPFNWGSLATSAIGGASSVGASSVGAAAL